MAGIPAQLLTDLRKVLGGCEQFETNRRLRALFADQRIIPWENSLPESETLSGRIDSVISYLYDKRSRDGSNALLLMLLVLADSIDPADMRRGELENLASRVAQALGFEQAEHTNASASEARKQTFGSTEPVSRSEKTGLATAVSTGRAVHEKKLLVFVSHASEDKHQVRNLCRQLKQDGFDPWLDEERLLPGQDWNREIEKALRASNAVLLCFSERSVSKEGYIQREFKRAIQYLEEKPEGTIYLIPVRLDNCELPDVIRKIQWVDFPAAYDRLAMALRIRAEKPPMF